MRGALGIVAGLAGACRGSEPPAVVAVPPVREIATDAGPQAGPPPVRPPSDAGAACVRDPKQDEICVDAKNAVACQKGLWVALACKGEVGCAPGAKGDVCDQSITDVGATCDLAADVACASTRNEMLTCAGDRWLPMQRCGGARGCSVAGKKITCDNSVAGVDDVCREEDDYACTADGASALVCRRGKFTPASLCRGPTACRVTGSKELGFKVECDDSRARLGDVCTKSDHFSCAEDGGAILICRSARFVLEDRCKGKERCAIKSGQVGCY